MPPPNVHIISLRYSCFICTNINEVNLSAFAYRLYHENISSILRATFIYIMFSIHGHSLLLFSSGKNRFIRNTEPQTYMQDECLPSVLNELTLNFRYLWFMERSEWEPNPLGASVISSWKKHVPCF